jgi:hypothetical protein
VATAERRLTFTDASPAAFLDGELRDHPLWVAAGDAAAAQRDRALAVLATANEDPAAFAVTSRYVLAVAHRG